MKKTLLLPILNTPFFKGLTYAQCPVEWCLFKENGGFQMKGKLLGFSEKMKSTIMYNFKDGLPDPENTEGTQHGKKGEDINDLSCKECGILFQRVLCKISVCNLNGIDYCQFIS